VAQALVATNPGQSLRPTLDQSSLKSGFFTDDTFAEHGGCWRVAMTPTPTKTKGLIETPVVACPFRVIRDQTTRLCLPVDVRFLPKATEALLCSETTRRANSRHRQLFDDLISAGKE
jgi:hypothetical protein